MKIIRHTEKRFLELGAERNRHSRGARFNEDWFTIGLSQKTPLDLKWDCNDPLPFPDNTFDLIFSSHFLEHLRHPIDHLKECLRILRPGGWCRANVPNARWLMERYLRGDTSLWKCVEELRSYRPGLHRRGYDEDTLREHFKQAGLRAVRTNSQGDTRVKQFTHRYFWTRRNRTIWAEGRKRPT